MITDKIKTLRRLFIEAIYLDPKNFVRRSDKAQKLRMTTVMEKRREIQKILNSASPNSYVNALKKLGVAQPTAEANELRRLFMQIDAVQRIFDQHTGRR